MNKILAAALFSTVFSVPAFAEDAPPAMADSPASAPAMMAPGSMHGPAAAEEKGDCDSVDHGLAHGPGMMDKDGDCDSEHGMGSHPMMGRTDDDCDSRHTGVGHPGYGMGMMGRYGGRGMGGPGYGMMGGPGGGMMGGPGGGMMMMMEPNMRLLGTLDLSKAQQEKVTRIADKLKHDNWATQGLLNDETAKLRDLYEADRRDPAAIGKEYQKVFDLKRKMIETYLEAENRIEDVLTPDQLGQMKEGREAMRQMYEPME
jgi:Spy/CpxP family protein refolding chaperone